MTLEVLQSESQVSAARKQLKTLGLSQVPSTWVRILRRLGLDKELPLGDEQKSWDVLRSVEFIGENLDKEAAILDIGCFCSEILPSLHCAGCLSLTGVDLNPEISRMPYPDSIRYSCQNFLQTDFSASAFDAVTSISVIEHGFDALALLREISRLLRPGGYFIASFDYWPDKVDTSGISIFDMSWQIFSEEEILGFVALAHQWGLEPVGKLSTAAADRVISCLGRSYTFGWLVLQKQVESGAGPSQLLD